MFPAGELGSETDGLGLTVGTDRSDGSGDPVGVADELGCGDRFGTGRINGWVITISSGDFDRRPASVTGTSPELGTGSDISWKADWFGIC